MAAIVLSRSSARRAGIQSIRKEPLKARANEERVKKRKPYDPYESKTEAVWAQVGCLILQAFLGKKIVNLEYHPMTFHLLGEDYRIDWMAIAEDGEIVFIETKGAKEAKNYRDARSKLRAASARFRYFIFLEARWPDQRHELRWEIEEIEVAEN